jgi:hypothetical protein
MNYAHGTGRIPNKLDTRDRLFGITARNIRTIDVLPKPQVRRNPWRYGQLLDQNGFDECVIYSFQGSIESAPYLTKLDWSVMDKHQIYDEVRARDGYPMPHEGTNSRAMCEWAKDKGLIDSYWWITDTNVAIDYVTHYGTLLQGTVWPNSFFNTNKFGYVELDNGTIDYSLGHEYKMRWYYPPSHKQFPDTFEYENTWGIWGYKGSGRFFMKRDVAEYLLWQAGGDLVLPIEHKK